MSTTFEVIPGASSYVTFGDLISASETNLFKSLSTMGIQREVKLFGELHFDTIRRVAEPGERFAWPHDMYAWIGIEGVDGGTDVECGTISLSFNDPSDPMDPWFSLTEFEGALGSEAEAFRETLVQAKERDIKWTFRRSAGQSALTSLSYGVIAATLADLTGGLVASFDCAWDSAAMPNTGSDFLESYMNPSRTISPEFADWAERCIHSIKREFS